jgi:hypothetical protein
VDVYLSSEERDLLGKRQGREDGLDIKVFRLGLGTGEERWESDHGLLVVSQKGIGVETKFYDEELFMVVLSGGTRKM